MSVELDPPEQLEFNRPFTQQVTRYLKVRNLHDVPVAYKVKTTAPRSYCVRPNSGRIEPGQEVEVQVLLQALKVDVSPDTKCKDKFLLQSTKITDPSGDVNLNELWLQIEKGVAEGELSKDVIQQKKIRCSAPTEDVPAKLNGIQPPTVPIVHNVPSGIPIQVPLVPTTPPNDTAPSPAAAQLEVQLAEAKAQLVEAKAQIAALAKDREIIHTNTIRNRSSQTPTTSTNNNAVSAGPPNARELVHTAPEQGVPVKIVAYLCLAAFLLAYLFF